METRKITKWVPIDVIVYIAADGTEWYNEKTCQLYEEGLKEKNKNVDGK